MRPTTRLLTDVEVAEGIFELCTGGKSFANGTAMRVYINPKDGSVVRDVFHYPPKTFGGPP